MTMKHDVIRAAILTVDPLPAQPSVEHTALLVREMFARYNAAGAGRSVTYFDCIGEGRT